MTESLPTNELGRLESNAKSLIAMAEADPGQFSAFDVVPLETGMGFRKGTPTFYDQLNVGSDSHGVIYVETIVQRPSTEADGVGHARTVRQTDTYSLAPDKLTVHTHERGELVGGELRAQSLDSSEGKMSDGKIRSLQSSINAIMETPRPKKKVRTKLGSMVFRSS